MKEYDVPEELCEIMETALSAKDARDSAVKGFFKYQLRNAVTLSEMARRKRLEFWEGIYSLYPELSGKNITFEPSNKIISIKKG